MDLPPITPKPSATPLNGKLAPAEAAAKAEQAARETARAFETAFLAEMLKHSGINRTPESTGGGAGEDAFASFLTQEYAKLISENGGVGVAEQIFNAINDKGPSG